MYLVFLPCGGDFSLLTGLPASMPTVSCTTACIDAALSRAAGLAQHVAVVVRGGLLPLIRNMLIGLYA